MKVKNMIMTGLVIGALAFVGCSTSSTSSDPIGTFLRNVTAGDCTNPAFLSEIPTGVVSPAQLQAGLQQVCMGMFGTVAAPATAPGNAPAIPGPAPTAAPAAH